jgi:hypothetical protein
VGHTRGRPTSGLVFVGDHYTTVAKESLEQLLDQMLERLGLKMHFIVLQQGAETKYQSLLEYYGDAGELVVWLGEIDGFQATLRTFLERGGHLLLISRTFNRSFNTEAFLEEMLYTDIGNLSRNVQKVHTLYPLEPGDFSVQHSSLQPTPPAEPLLLNNKDQVVGLRLDTGRYRAIYLPFDLNFLKENVRHWLLEPSLLFLQQQAVQQARLDVPDHQMEGQTLLVQPGSNTRVRAQIEGLVGRAELIVHLGLHEALDTVPMQRLDQHGEVLVFEGSFRPPGPGRYRLTLRSYSPEDQILVTAASLWVLVQDTEKSVLVLQDGGLSLAAQNSFETPLTTLGLEGNYLELDWTDGPFYPLLLDRYLDEDKLVVWLGQTMNQKLQAALQRFLERGGRLLVAAAKLHESPEIGPFLSEVLHVQNPQVRSRQEIQGLGLLPGPPLSFSVPQHISFGHISPPAVPLLYNESGGIAGVQVDNGVYRLIFLPFQLSGLDLDSRQQLLETVLRFIHNGPVFETALEVPDDQMIRHRVLTEADSPTLIRAHIKGAVEEASLVVQSYDLKPVAEQPMRLISSQALERHFETAFQPPGLGSYQIFLRLQAPGSLPFLATTSLRLDALDFGQRHPVLVFLDESIPAQQKDAVRADVKAVLQQLRLEANMVEQAPAEAPLYEALLDHYLEDGVVIWLGGSLSDSAQAAFRRFLEGGGRLLMSSINFRYAPRSKAFLHDMLHVEDISLGFPVRGRQFFNPNWPAYRTIRLDFASITPGRSVEVILQDEDGRGAGVQVATDLYRAVYLSFELKDLDSPVRRELLESNLAFLQQAVVQQVQLQLKPQLKPGSVVMLGPLSPKVTISNSGKGLTQELYVGYQVLQGEQVIASAAQQQAALNAEAQKEVTLPPWRPEEPGDYLIRFGAAEAGKGDLEYGLVQHLHILDKPVPFEPVALAGEVSQGNGAAFFDYDSDGDLDIYLVRLGQANRLFNNDQGSFSETAAQAGLDGAGRERGVAIADYDGDGDLDLYLVSEQVNQFFRNAGDGTFVDFTAMLDTSLADGYSGRSAAFFDCDEDGDLDLYLVNATGVNRLYRNEKGDFLEQAQALGLADTGSGRGLAIGDYDGDYDEDLFIANSTGESRLYRNDYSVFTETSMQAGLQLAGGEVAAVFGDYDSDGDVDLFISNERGANQLYDNQADGTFQDATKRDTLNLGQKTVGTAFFDYDNDGDLDLVTTAVNAGAGGDELYHNRDPYLFPVGTLLNLEPGSSGRGLSFADYDGDGSVDLLVADAVHSRLYRNTAASSHWLQVELRGPELNRQGLGAQVEVASGNQHQMRQMQLGYGYASQRPARLHFGLGSATQAETLRVVWPDGEQTVYYGITANQLLQLEHPQRTTAVQTSDEMQPISFWLWPNYPNPFNASTTFSYQVAEQGAVRLTLYNIAGQSIKPLVDAIQAAGRYQVSWDGHDEQGRPVASGIYFYSLQTAAQQQTRRLVLLR